MLDNLSLVGGIDVPEKTARLLYVSDIDAASASFQDGVSIRIHLNTVTGHVEVGSLPPYDPSTIFTQLPVKKPRANQNVPGPSYYPTYKGLTPFQRWIYLNWLTDTSQQIDTGYVFIYYYGLERRLLTGEMGSLIPQSVVPDNNATLVDVNALVPKSSFSEFEAAFDEVITLRRHHTSSSFIHYSHSALTHACIYRKRLDKLQELYRHNDTRELENIDLLVAYHAVTGLSAHDLMRLPKKVSGFSRKKMKISESSYEECLATCLLEKYGKPDLPLSTLFRTDELPKKQNILFANISFPSGFRSQIEPSFFLHEPFQDHVVYIFVATEQKIQTQLQTKRKSRGMI